MTEGLSVVVNGDGTFTVSGDHVTMIDAESFSIDDPFLISEGEYYNVSSP
jgi:hypothetical protein